MASPKEWRYKPLSSDSSIRIMMLQPAEKLEDPLECRLEETTIEKPRSYVAVSYVWGNESDPSVIFCEGAHLSITRNLDGALRKFRKEMGHGHEVLLWVDSICINQQDIQELGSQVSIMGHVYRNAQYVLIWLGNTDEDEDTTAAMECFRALLKFHAKRDELARRVHARVRNGMTMPFNTADISREFKLPDADPRRLTALLNFFRNRPWFRRSWTFQESVLARKKYYCVGSLLITAPEMLSVCQVLTDLCVQLRETRYAVDTSILWSVVGLDGWDAAGRSHQARLAQCLIIQRGSGCKKPSDLVYSLLGVARDSWISCIKPDYSKPFQDVFAETTADLIRESGNFLIFSEVDWVSGPGDLPSWMPDWRRKKSDYQPIYSEPTGWEKALYRAAGSSKAEVHLSDDKNELTVRGIAVDTLLSFIRGQSKSIELGVQFLNPPDKMYKFTHETMEEAMIRTIWADCVRFDPRDGGTRWGPNTFSHLQQEFKRTSKVGSHAHGLLSFATSIYDLGPNEEIILTENQMLGKITQAAQFGDIITLLLGGEVPIVLRPDGDKYRVIGECYLHGFMDGKGFIEARKKADPTYDGMDNSWLQRLHNEQIPFPTQRFILI